MPQGTYSARPSKRSPLIKLTLLVYFPIPEKGEVVKFSASVTAMYLAIALPCWFYFFFTSHKEFLSIDPGLPFGLLQERDPVVHLLRDVTVAVNDSVCRDNHKGIRPAEWERNRSARPGWAPQPAAWRQIPLPYVRL